MTASGEGVDDGGEGGGAASGKKKRKSSSSASVRETAALTPAVKKTKVCTRVILVL